MSMAGGLSHLVSKYSGTFETQLYTLPRRGIYDNMETAIDKVGRLVIGIVRSGSARYGACFATTGSSSSSC
jgi:hypothetical protein